MKILLALIVALLIPFSVQAEDTTRNIEYLQLRMGLWTPVPGSITTNDNGTFTGGQTTLDRGMEFGIAYGAYWDLIGFQIHSGYQWFDNKTFSTSNIPIIAMARVRLPIELMSPYVEFGGGGVYSSSTLRPVGTSQVKMLYSYGGGIGIDVQISPEKHNMFLGFEARYMYVQPVTLSWGTPSNNTINMSSVILTANFGWIL